MYKSGLLCSRIFVISFMISAIANGAGLSTNNIRFVTDITTPIRGKYYTDKNIISIGKYAAGNLLAAESKELPQGVALDAFLVCSNNIFFSTDVDFENNGTTYADEDLIRLDLSNNQLSLFFDGSAHGVKPTADLDAATIAGNNSATAPLYLSFDITQTLPNIGIVADEDIAIVKNGIFSEIIKGQDLGIPAVADIDALYIQGNTLYFSLDITAEINGHIGTDSDIWAMDMGTSNVTYIGDVGIIERSDLAGLDQPVDSDNDLLTDYEEFSGIDDPASAVPGMLQPLLPHGYITSVVLPDTDADGFSDGIEAIYGTNPLDPLSYPDLSGGVLIIR